MSGFVIFATKWMILMVLMVGDTPSWREELSLAVHEQSASVRLSIMIANDMHLISIALYPCSKKKTLKL